VKVTASSLCAKNLIVNTIAFSTRIPVKVPVANEAANISCAVRISFSIDHGALAAVAAIH